MKALLLAQISNYATRAIMGFIADLVKVLMAREDSSIDTDGKAILALLNKNVKEDKVAGFDKLRDYANKPVR
jgi:hypothetical protein